MASFSLIDASSQPSQPSHPQDHPAPRRRTPAFGSAQSARRYWVLMVALSMLAAALALLLIWWDNPMEFGSRGFWLIAERRSFSVAVMAIVATCHGLATVAFQTVAHNRIVTPSIMGFEALYVTIHTSLVYFFGVSGLLAFTGPLQFGVQVVVMVVLALLLYGWLLDGHRGDMQLMLLIGIIIGGGLASLSTFMRRMLSPSEFDLLTARMFGSVNNADASYLPIAVPVMAVAASVLLMKTRTLNVLSLGKEATANLGVNYRRHTIVVLTCVACLMAVSTALIGPMTFLGFLVATLAYQAADTYDHRLILPMAAVLGFVVLAGAYFVMNHIFYAQGVVSIIIELVGGLVFLTVILKKGTL
ncbi:Iron-uptake system permease protein FeuC [Corynebacterium ciconiae DSM 44920]|uniref:iron chelate uptake ABC transporter family permease subunit n=1 Tax=Corynebacterium ciconiae TaxID=227319 RepID=UPI000372F0C5|nr:iron chelate uptake ABC transporter family permease subunit [Corynebacterium ciconiae]WKD61747.1 Iron-uptake system permease protein FeuC [Corynebacterium ciconiae DSM 44920]